MKSQRWVPQKYLWVDEKSEVGTPLKTWVDENSEVGTPLKNLGWWKVRGGHPSKNLGWWKVRGGHPLKTFGLMKVRGGHPFGLMEIPKNAKLVQMAKNLVHSFYHILYQPKGVPTSSCNFSGSGGMLWKFRNWLLDSVRKITLKLYREKSSHTSSLIQFTNSSQ